MLPEEKELRKLAREAWTFCPSYLGKSGYRHESKMISALVCAVSDECARIAEETYIGGKGKKTCDEIARAIRQRFNRRHKSTP